mgnify:FL=1
MSGVTAVGRGACLGLLVLVLGLCACGEGAEGTAPTPVIEDKTSALIGTWHTMGNDPDLGGQVDVRLHLQQAGGLRVVETQVDGPLSLSFPGTWSLLHDESDTDLLQLRGAWFEPDGAIDVRCEIRDDVLILTAADGNTQSWQRVADDG